MAARHQEQVRDQVIPRYVLSKTNETHSVLGSSTSPAATTPMETATCPSTAGHATLWSSTTSSRTLELTTHPLVPPSWVRWRLTAASTTSTELSASTSPPLSELLPFTSTGRSAATTAPAARSTPRTTSTRGLLKAWPWVLWTTRLLPWRVTLALAQPLLPSARGIDVMAEVEMWRLMNGSCSSLWLYGENAVLGWLVSTLYTRQL